MAGDSLGTMTVGVTANVSDAERALNGLANMLERFDRQQQSRSRPGGGKGGAGGGGYFSPMSEEFQNEIKRMEQVQKRTEAALRFREIRRSEEMAANTRQLDEKMGGLSESFKVGGAAGAEEYLNRTNRAIQQVGDTSARTRYAVLNLGYGVQDAVTVFGTSGLAGAIRASANNLQGLGVLFDKTAGGMKGLTAALMSGEFVVMGIATAVLLAASAWEDYNKKVQEAIDKQAEERTKRIQPQKEIEKAGREEALNRELARMEKLADAEAKRKKAADDLAVEGAKLTEFAKQEIDLKQRIAKIQKELADYAAVQAAVEQEAAGGFGGVPKLTAAEKAARDAVEGRGGVPQTQAELKKLQEQLDTLMKQRESTVADRDAAQKELDAIKKREAELQPDAISNAQKQVQAYERQIKAIDALIKKEQDASAPLRDRKRAYDDMQKAYESGVEKQKKIDEEFAIAVRGRSNPFAQRRLRESLEKKYGLTKEEKEAMGVLGTVGGMEDKAAFDQQYARTQERADRYAGIMETLKKKLAAIFKTYPQLDPNDIPLEKQQSDMEYRVSFLNKKRREVEARMRRGDQFTGVAQFESATAYEALARSRMGPAPETDTLRKILVAEEKATAALEDIREKLDPGRRERLVILESFE